MYEKIPPENVIFRGLEARVMQDAILAGAGIGFLPVADAAHYPNLVEVTPPRKEWTAPMWLVTHVDLHRTTKVQAFLKFLKAEAKGWGFL